MPPRNKSYFHIYVIFTYYTDDITYYIIFSKYLLYKCFSTENKFTRKQTNMPVVYKSLQ